MIEWIKKRVAERSTWVGIMTLAGLFGYSIRPELQEQLLTAIAAITAVIFTITSDKKPVEVTNVVEAAGQTGIAPTVKPKRPDPLIEY